MFLSLSILPLAQIPSPLHQEMLRPQEVRPLPGQLDRVPVFNSNSPELILNDGILLSTFSPRGKSTPSAHLDYPLQGRFDIFAHHVAKAPTAEDLRTLYLGIILHNPTPQTITITIEQAASYLSQPDAPFIELPTTVEDPLGTVYAGPGSRVMGDILRERRQNSFPSQIIIPSGESRMLLNLPIPVRDLDPPLNGRSTYLRLRSDGRVYVASLAKFAPTDGQGQEREPTLAEWEQVLEGGDLVKPRDRAPTPLNTPDRLVYGRVAGVSLGSTWKVRLSEGTALGLEIPPPGEAISYTISSLEGGTLGTGQSQSAAMLVRYPDTAYKAHGNYGVHYSLTLPLSNPTSAPRTVTVALETPLKDEQLQGGLRFQAAPDSQVLFRGTVRCSYTDEQGIDRTRYFHLVQHRGQQGDPLVTVTIPANDWRIVQVDLLYPPDATPPQVLTIQTLP